NGDGGGFDEGGEAAEDAAEDDDGQQQVVAGFEQGGAGFGPVERRGLRAVGDAAPSGPGGDDGHEQKAWQQPAEEELFERLLGVEGVENDGQAGRKQQSDGAGDRDQAQRGALGVFGFGQDRQQQPAHRKDRDAGGAGE